MNNRLRSEIDSLPLPEELGARSAAGIARAAAERRAARRSKRGRWAAAAAAGLLLLSTSLLNGEVRATIRQALNFVPGIGVLDDRFNSDTTYVLAKPVTVDLAGGSLTISGIVVNDKMTYITVSAERVPHIEGVTMTNAESVSYPIRASGRVNTSDRWGGSFWYNGALDLRGQVKLVFDGYPDTVLSLELVESDPGNTYSSLGETASAAGIDITAIADRVGERGRISLISEQDGPYRINSYGTIGDERQDRRMTLTDETGRMYELERPMSYANAPTYYFPLAAGDGHRYTLTIPVVSAEYPVQQKVSLPVPPPESMLPLNRTVELAGFPIVLERIERIGPASVRVYLDVGYREEAQKSLMGFNIDRSSMAKLSEQTGAYEYIEFDVEPGSGKTELLFQSPEVLIRGPWTITLPGERYFGAGE